MQVEFINADLQKKISGHLFRKNINDLEVIAFSEINSTNTFAKKIIEERHVKKAVIVSEKQTEGRGRLGRKFFSPEKTGLYLSIIYTMQNGITNPAMITVSAAVSVSRAIKKLFNIEVKVKWINDIFLNGKKIAGILTEGAVNPQSQKIESCVIGIGINLSDGENGKNKFPDELKKTAGSLFGTEKINSENIIAELSAEIFVELENIFSEPQEKIVSEYKSLLFMLGKKIKVFPVAGDGLCGSGDFYFATVTDLSREAGLVVLLDDGSKKILTSGEVSLRSENLVE